MDFLESPHAFEVVSEVLETWDKVKMVPNYDEMLGFILFKKMYEIAPDELCTFSFTHKDVENKTEKFVAFAIRFVRMLDMSIDLLGPDMDILDEQLSDLGVAHKHFGVSQRHYDLMGKALIYGLGVILCRNTFIDSRKDARETVFKFMSTAMVNGAESV